MSLMSSIDQDDLEIAARRGQILLDKLQFAEAESVFRDILRQLDAHPPPSIDLDPPSDTSQRDGSNVGPMSVSWQELARQKADRTAVVAVAGLGETFARQSKMATSAVSSSTTGDERVTDWLRLMVHALSLHRDAADLARRAERRHRGRLTTDDTEFLKDAEAMSLSRARMLEDALITTVKDQVLSRNGLATSSRGRHPPSHTNNNDNNNNSNNKNNGCNEWLKTVLSRCSESSTGTDNEETSPDITDSISSSSSSLSLSLGGSDLQTLTSASGKFLQNQQQLTSPDRKCRRRINFDRIQTAIRQLVDEASNDVRAQYGHLLMNGATQLLMQRRVASELMLRLARTDRDGGDMETALENAIMYEEDSDGEQDGKNPLGEEPAKTNDDDASDSGSESDYGTDDYETILVDCPADSGHAPSVTSVVQVDQQSSNTTADRGPSNGPISCQSPPCDPPRNAASPDSGRVQETGNGNRGTTPLSGTPERENVRVSNSVTVIGLNNYGSFDKDAVKGIITVWKSYDPGHSSNGDVTNQEQQSPRNSAKNERRPLCKLPSFEEVSPLTERERVFRWLDAIDSAPPPSLSQALPSDGRQSDITFLTTSKLSQTVGLVSLSVAESLRNDAHFQEACDVYKYALGIFQDHPPRDVVEGSSPYSQLVAGLLRDIGIVKCNMGDMTAGCQLMEESATLYEWKPPSGSTSGNDDELTAAILNSRRATKVAEVWYQLGNMFLSDELRGESLLDYTMLVVQMSMGGSNGGPPKESTRPPSDDAADDSSSVVSSDQDDSYSVCTQEAISCYQRVLDVLDRSRCTSTDDITRSELNANTLSRLADCYLLTNQFQRAIDCYERSLPHFRSAAIGLTSQGRREIALLNAHVLGQLGTVNYMLSNYMRAAAVYEMAAMLRQHLADASMDADSDSDTTPAAAAARSTVCLEAAWMRSMYGLTLSALGRHHQCVVWSLRAFTEYIRVLRGQIITVRPPVRRWFVVETLFSLGQSYGVVDNGQESAVHYLTLAKNLIRAAPEEDMDIQQTFKVLMALAEALDAAGDSDEAIKYHTEAIDLASTVDVDLLDDLDQPASGPSVATDSSSVKNHAPTGLSDIIGMNDVIPESVIRDGVTCIIDQLDSSWNAAEESKRFNPEVADTTTSIREAERLLQEAVRQTSGSPTVVNDVLRAPASDVNDATKICSTSGHKRSTSAAFVSRVEQKDQSPITTSTSALNSVPPSQWQVPAVDNGHLMSVLITDKQTDKTELLDTQSGCVNNGTSSSISTHVDRLAKSIPGQTSGVVETTLYIAHNGHTSQQKLKGHSTSLKIVVPPISSV